jgi:predicted dehydrogenase
MNLGVIGAGEFTKFCLASYRRHLPELKLTAIADIKVDLADAVAHEYQITHRYNSAEALMADKTVDIVAIFTPPNTHFDLAKKALLADKHVLVEKPIVFTNSQATELIHLAASRHRVLTSNLLLRYHPFHWKLKQLVQSGELGELKQIITTALLAEYPPKHWYWDQKISGGFFLNTFCHFFDLYRFISNDRPLNHRTYGDETTGFTIITEFKKIVATLNVNLHQSNEQEYVTSHYIFSKATITTHDWLPSKMIVVDRQGELSQEASQPKAELYQKLLAQVMQDLMRSAKNPEYRSPIQPEDLANTVADAVEASG